MSDLLGSNSGTKKNKTFHAMMLLNADSCANVVFADAPMKCGKEGKTYPVPGESAAPFVAAAGGATTAAVANSTIAGGAANATATADAPVGAANETAAVGVASGTAIVAEGTVVGDMYTVSGCAFCSPVHRYGQHAEDMVRSKTHRSI